MRKRNILTQKEEFLMDILWKESEQETKYRLNLEQIERKMPKYGYYNSNLSSTIDSLLEKGYIYRMIFEKTFYIPRLSREDYAMELIASKGIGETSILALIRRLALYYTNKSRAVKKAQKKEIFLKKLRNIIDTIDERDEE